MKGVIADCLSKLITEKFGKEKWEAILEKCSLEKRTLFFPTNDVDDTLTMQLVTATCEIVSLTAEQAADAFGEYWVNSYAPKIYGMYMNRFKTAKEMIMGMDAIHDTTTKTIANARPPRFDFSEPDEKSLLVTYKSSRNLLGFYIGLVKGVGTYFKTKINIIKLSENQIKLTFA